MGDTHQVQPGNGGAAWDGRIPKSVILEQAERVLGSQHFRSSRRCSAFLRYVVRQTCERHPEMLKERTLGVEVFSRDPHYDTNQDPVVRSTAGEVRKRLAQYYLEPAHARELRINLPSGTYVAGFAEPDGGRSPRRWPRTWVLAPVAGLAAVVVSLVAVSNGRTTPLSQFWAPVLDSSSKPVICLGQPKVFDFTSRTQRDLHERFGASVDIPDGASKVLAGVSVQSMIPMWDRYVVLGDTIASAGLAAFFARADKPFEVRGARSTSLGDLRGRPAVLIGAFNNHWTLTLTEDLRYYFEAESEYGRLAIRDREDLANTRWSLENSWPEWNVAVDYGVVTKVLEPTIERTIVVAAGITHYGTIAAAEFLTSEEYLAGAILDAPEGWADLNMQAVISTRVIDGDSGPPEVEAVHFWE